MAVGNLNLIIGVDAKKIRQGIRQIEGAFKSAMTNIKKTLSIANIGALLLQGADGHIAEYMAKAKAKMNLKEMGFDDLASEQLFNITNEFEKLGLSADSANQALTQFIATGRARALSALGVELGKHTAQTLASMTANERLNYVLANSNSMLGNLSASMPEHIKNMLNMKKTADDVKKSLGASFLSVLSGIIKAFGGVGNAMRVAIVAFSAYKIAMIVGNVAIGISKAIAMGGAFATPIAIAMGLAGLATIGGILATAGIAMANVPSNSVGSVTNKQFEQGVASAPQVNVAVHEDEFGRQVKTSSGGSMANVQSNYTGGGD